MTLKVVIVGVSIAIFPGDPALDVLFNLVVGFGLLYLVGSALALYHSEFQ